MGSIRLALSFGADTSYNGNSGGQRIEELDQMASLADTNPHLKDRKKLFEMIAKSVYESSIFEGASPRALKSELQPSRERRIHRSKKASKSA